MGYLDKTTITVDAILTKKGRELLAQGSEFFNITQFALADDEIDYNLGRDVGIKFRNGDVSKVLASVVYNAGV